MPVLTQQLKNYEHWALPSQRSILLSSLVLAACQACRAWGLSKVDQASDQQLKYQARLFCLLEATVCFCVLECPWSLE